MKKIDIIVEARTGSSRMPNKILEKIINKPCLELMIERLKRVSLVEDIIIATTTKSSDDEIENLSSKCGVKCFRGSENDVMGRVLDAAIKFNTDIIVEITGDTPCIDPKISSEIIKTYLNNAEHYDLVTNDLGFYKEKYKIEFPLGFSTKVFSVDILKQIYSETNNKYDREHVVHYIIQNEDRFSLFDFKANEIYKNQNFRLTLDYKEDFELIKIVYENLYTKNKSFSAIDIIDFLNENPQFKKINSMHRIK